MSRIAPARRMPNAGFAARILRKLRPVILKTVVLLLIVAIGFPLQFGSNYSVEARPKVAIAPPPPAASPEAFVLQQAETRAVASVPADFGLPISDFGFLRSGVSTLTELFVTPELPAGFENAKLPTLTERLTFTALSLFAFAAPKRSAIRNPQSAMPAPPPPAGTVLFDFDEDGKADVGRWQTANTEFKVRNSSNGSY